LSLRVSKRAYKSEETGVFSECANAAHEAHDEDDTAHDDEHQGEVEDHIVNVCQLDGSDSLPLVHKGVQPNGDEEGTH
jgi:hypothetical protein